MILIAEPVHFGDTHVQINAAVASLIQSAMPGERMLVIAEEAHLNALKEKGKFSAKGLDIQTFQKYSSEGTFYWLQKISGECKTILSILKIAKQEKAELVVWLSLFPTGQWFLHFLCFFFFRNLKHLIVLHGEMEYLSGTSPKWQDGFLATVLKLAFRLSDSHNSYLFLSDTAKQSFEKNKIITKSKIFSILHPFIFSESLIFKPAFSPLRIVLFGALQQSKNVKDFFEMAARFASEVQANKINFITVGKMHPDLQLQCNKWVQSYKPDEFISQQELEQQLSACHLAVFFYDLSKYKWSASGAILEAINSKIPVLILENDYFREISAKQKVGISVQNKTQMYEQLRRLLDSPDNFLSVFYPEINAFIHQNSFLLQTEKIKSILEKALS